jgi:branched-chain amino acid transport system substrate-binding protein
MKKLSRKIDRRRFLQTSAAAGAIAAASPLFAPAVHAANARIKIGYVTPQSGPLAAFAASDDFNIKGFMEATKGVVESAGSTFDVEVVVKDSQSNPNRAAEVAKE